MSTVGVFVLVTCVISVIKFLDKTDRRKGGGIWAHPSRNNSS